MAMRKMFAAAAMLALLCGAVQAQGVTITEENPRPPKTYRATDLASLLKQDFAITVRAPSESRFALEFGEHFRSNDTWSSHWAAEFTLVPVGLRLSYSWTDEKPDVFITLFSRYLELRVIDERKPTDDTTFLGSRLGVSVEIESFPTSKLSPLEIATIKDAVIHQKPLRFKGSVSLHAAGDTLAELRKRMRDLIFHLRSVEKVEAAEGKPASKTPGSPTCSDPDICPF